MKYVCSQCGELFDGVYCSNCGKKAEKPAVITVSRPELEVEEEEDFSFLTTDRDRKKQEKERKKSKKRLERQRARADKAAKKVERIETKEADKVQEEREKISKKTEKELIKGDRAGRREERLLAAEQSRFFPLRMAAQSLHAVGYSLCGKTRQAIHFVVSPRGSLAGFLMIPLCAVIPLCAAIAVVALGGAQGVRPEEMVSSFFSRLSQPLVRSFAMWGELCAAMIVLITAHGFVIRSKINILGAFGLVMTAQLPMLFLSPIFVVGLLILPALSLFLAILAVFQAVILLYIGVEFAARDIKKGVFTSFSVLLALMLITAVILAAINFDTAADWLFGTMSRIS